LGYACVDEVVPAGFEDHPARLREVMAEATRRSVAWTYARASSPVPPLLAPANLGRPLQQMASIKRPTEFARVLGCSLSALRADLRAAELPPPRATLAWLRLHAAGRLLGDSSESADRISRALGYTSATSFRNAVHAMLGATPVEVRNSGGLSFVAVTYRAAVANRRRGGLARSA
jgi:AraC-like DNA-binding protein